MLVGRETNKGANRETKKGANRGTNKGANRETNKGANRETNKGTNRETNKGANRETSKGANLYLTSLYSCGAHPGKDGYSGKRRNSKPVGVLNFSFHSIIVANSIKKHGSCIHEPWKAFKNTYYLKLNTYNFSTYSGTCFCLYTTDGSTDRAGL